MKRALLIALAACTPAPPPPRPAPVVATAAPIDGSVAPAAPIDAAPEPLVTMTVDASAPVLAPDAAIDESASSPHRPLTISVRFLDRCPTPAVSLPPVRASCPAFSSAQAGPDLIAPSQHPAHVELHSAAEYRKAFGCEPPAGFDWRHQRITAITLTESSSTSARIAGMTNNRVLFEFEHACQGTRTISFTHVVPIAIPAAMTSLVLEYCDPPHPPCGAVP